MKNLCLNCGHTDNSILKIHNTRGIAVGLIFLSLFMPIGFLGIADTWHIQSDSSAFSLILLLSAGFFIIGIDLLIIRFVMKKQVCHLCNSSNLVPASSPIAQKFYSS